MTTVIPAAWMPRVPMKRLIGHWTAGNHTASSTDRKAYHVLFEGDGKVVRGVPSISANSGSLKNGYAAHTLNCNTDSIGASMCGMAGAVEVPFNPGRAPLTLTQWNAFVAGTAELADFYKIPIGHKTTLFHAEVQANLGITQRNKWDVIRLPFEPSVVGAKAVGDKWRREMAEYLAGGAVTAPLDPVPAGAIAIAKITTPSSSTKDGEATGSIPAGTLVEVVTPGADRVRVKTPAGFNVWVDRVALNLVDGPPVLEPTKPDPRRQMIADIRKQLDALEASL